MTFNIPLSINAVNYIVQAIMIVCAVSLIRSAPDIIGGLAGISADLAGQGDQLRAISKDQRRTVRNAINGNDLINGMNKTKGLLASAVPGGALLKSAKGKISEAVEKFNANRLGKEQEQTMKKAADADMRVARNAYTSKVLAGTATAADRDAYNSALKLHDERISDAKVARKTVRATYLNTNTKQVRAVSQARKKAQASYFADQASGKTNKKK